MNPAKLDGIAHWPPPENVKQLQSFLGFCNFYRRFIDHYADKIMCCYIKCIHGTGLPPNTLPSKS